MQRTATRAKKRRKLAAGNESLEEQIKQSPDSPQPYLVYGDWLQQAGDPRGELVAIQAAQIDARGEELGRLKILERELLNSNAKQFFGPLTRFRKARHTRLDWFCGFVRAMDGSFAKDATFLEHPSARFIRQLSGFEINIPPLLLTDLATSQDDLRGIWSAPRLKTLRIGSWGDVEIGAVEHPSLELLHVHRPSHRVFGALAKAELPRLQTLSLRGIGPDETKGLIKALEGLETPAFQLGLQSAIRDGAFVGLEPVAPRVSLLELEYPSEEVINSLRSLDFAGVEELRIQGVNAPVRDTLFTQLPELPRLKTVRLTYPSDLVRYYRGFAHSELAKQVEELDLHVGRPGAGRALAEGRYEAATRLTLSFDPDLGAEYLQSHRLLQSDAFPEAKALRLSPVRHIESLAPGALASQIERLEVPLDKDRDARLLLDHLDAFTSLKTLVLEGERQLSPEMLTALFGSGLDVRWPRNERWVEVEASV